MSGGSDTIYCIGDSHVSFFSGQDLIQPCWPDESSNLLPPFEVFRLGPVLAYNLIKPDATTRGRERLFEVLWHLPCNRRLRRLAHELGRLGLTPKGRERISRFFSGLPYNRFFRRNPKVLLCFGEIDCRAHLLKQAEAQNRATGDVIAECVERYFAVILEVKKLGYEIIVWNAIPSTPYETSAGLEFPTYGNCKERNEVTRLFNNMLSNKCSTHGFKFVSVFDELVDHHGITQGEYLFDGFHLGQNARKLALTKMRALGVVSGDSSDY